MMACGLHILPDRRTFDRRFKVLPIGSMISTMGKRFVTDAMIDSKIVSVDSSMIRAKNGSFMAQETDGIREHSKVWN
jgi:hypothetical protein